MRFNRCNRRERPFYKWLFFLLMIIFCWYISNNWYQFMLIQGQSMEPSYHNLQLAVLNKNDRDYKADDVIAFECKGLSVVLVKRVVGEPGDQVVIREGKLYVNGYLFERYAQNEFEYAGMLECPIRLSENQYIVIGDNIGESKDSRYEMVGIVEEDGIIGKVIGFPFQEN